ncbi:MAG: hypothetical protein EXR12_13900 [Rhodospirillaceae bacterium]|nr:hypothetical protein [Rhodospirillaceae bacterium]
MANYAQPTGGIGVRAGFDWSAYALLFGPRRSLVVETAGMRFNVECPATRSMAVGEEITLMVDVNAAWAL